MPLINWGPTFELGVRVIDEQHQGLVSIINRLNEINAGVLAAGAMDGVFAELVAYTREHFSTEEALMRQHALSRTTDHQNAHRQFIKVVTELQEKYRGGDATIPASVLSFLRSWLAHHILDTDKLLARALIDRGVR